MDQSLIVSVLVCATTAYVFGVFYKEKNKIKYKYEIRSLYISQKSVYDVLDSNPLKYESNIAHE
jgi:sorbitol-specific phosphotransferase system component IIC